MIHQTKPIKPYKLEAARPGQTDVTPLRQVVEAAVRKTDKDGKARVLYYKSTAPSADQSPQPFITTKFDSQREDVQVRSTAPRRIAQGQHQQATEYVSGLVNPLQNLPGPAQQASHSITALCNTHTTKLFGVPCTLELLQQLKQIESEQQVQRAAQQLPQAQANSATSRSPKPLPVPPLKLSPQEKPTSIGVPACLPSGPGTDRPRHQGRIAPTAGKVAAVSNPTSQLHSETSTEDGSEHSPGKTKAKTKAQSERLARFGHQGGTRYNVKDPATERRVAGSPQSVTTLPEQVAQSPRSAIEPYERWEQNIDSLQAGFFPDERPRTRVSSTRQALAQATTPTGGHDAPPSPARTESTDTAGRGQSAPTIRPVPKSPGRMVVRPSLRRPESTSITPRPTHIPASDDGKRDTPEPQPPQSDTQ